MASIQQYQFRLGDIFTGRVLDTIQPSSWSWTDPLTGQAAGTFTFGLPRDQRQVDLLGDLIGVGDRVQLGVWDTVAGRYLFGGPVPKPAVWNPTDGTLTISPTDWRAYFYSLVFRPNADGSQNDYIQANIEQAQAMRDVIAAGLATYGVPSFAVDDIDDTGVMRQVTFRQFDGIGASLDDLAARERGIEWWTSIDAGPNGEMLPRVRFAWPERSTRAQNLVVAAAMRIEDRGYAGNNVAEQVAWPEQPNPQTRVFALGEGQPPDQVWASDEDPTLGDGVSGTLLRETVAGPFTGVVDADTAFEHAFAQREALNASAPVDVILRTDRADLDPATYDVGDRVDLLVSDLWQSREIDDARIISRVLAGGRNQSFLATLTIDLGTGNEDIEE